MIRVMPEFNQYIITRVEKEISKLKRPHWVIEHIVAFGFFGFVHGKLATQNKLDNTYFCVLLLSFLSVVLVCSIVQSNCFMNVLKKGKFKSM